MSKDAIQKAWEAYHGPIVDEGGEDYIPAMPPAFRRGFVDGFEYARQGDREQSAAIATMDALRGEAQP